MSETQKKETEQSAQEETKQAAQEEPAAPTERIPSWAWVSPMGRHTIYWSFSHDRPLEPHFGGKFPFVVFPTSFQIFDEGESSSTEEATQQEMQAECVRLSGYINGNISDIIKLREENDRLSEELRMAMAKLRAA